MSRTPRKLAVLSIGCDDYVLPLAQASQVIGIMASAVPVRRDYASSRHCRWIMTMEPARLHLDSVSDSQIVAPVVDEPANRPARPDQPRLLGRTAT